MIATFEPQGEILGGIYNHFCIENCINYFLILNIAKKYDFPAVPMKLMNTSKMSRERKDKLKKQQKKLEKCLDVLGVNEHEFYVLFRDNPEKVCLK